MSQDFVSLKKEHGKFILVRNAEEKVAKELKYLSSQLESDRPEIDEEHILNKLQQAHNLLVQAYAFDQSVEELRQACEQL